jgi:hypothetical protein
MADAHHPVRADPGDLGFRGQVHSCPEGSGLPDHAAREAARGGLWAQTGQRPRRVRIRSRARPAAVEAAYVEGHAVLSPGQLLDAHILRALLDEGWTKRLDSVALPAHPLERLWKHAILVGQLAPIIAMQKLARHAREMAKIVTRGVAPAHG